MRARPRTCLTRTKARGAALAAAVLSGSALLNACWLGAFDTVWELRAGYYLWWGSLVLASGASLMRARALSSRSSYSAVSS